MKKIISKIDGVQIIKKNQIIDDRGRIMHMMRNDDKNFKQFGEIYFSSVYPKAIKAWHLHTEMTLNYVVVWGKVKLVLYDDRKKSITKGMIDEIILSMSNYCIVKSPPFIWNGFSSVNNCESIIANCSDIPHDKNEIIRIPYDDTKIPYKWKFDY
mgnify:FL=1